MQACTYETTFARSQISMCVMHEYEVVEAVATMYFVQNLGKHLAGREAERSAK